MTIEYRVKPVTRYIVTRHEGTGSSGSVRQIGGAHDSAEVAYQVGYALARQEQETLGLPPGDMGVIFPQHPNEQNLKLVDAPSALTDAQIKHMTERFLGWRLPENFQPDGGISFELNYNNGTPEGGKHEPVGTNLLGYTQAKAMVVHMIEGLPNT